VLGAATPSIHRASGVQRDDGGARWWRAAAPEERILAPTMNAIRFAICAAIGAIAVTNCSSSPVEDSDGGAGGAAGGGAAGHGGGGTSGAGGSLGADAGTMADANAGGAGAAGGDSGDDCGCVAEAISWGNDGGRVAYVDRSTLSPCRTFSHQREPAGSNPPTLMCAQQLGTCTSSVSAREINVALDQPDVRAAIAAAPILFGRDSRAFDGAVLQIKVGAALIEIGSACSGAPDCKDIPQTVTALGIRLRALTAQELALGACRNSFGAD
jgi:hypothetical protein